MHFHYSALNIIREGECRKELDDVSYDRGAYFVRPYVRGQTMSLHAYFVPETDPEPQQEQAVSTDILSRFEPE